ncbi:hypothetical protein [Streptomyces sp. ME19-01-6]|uniref:hypothetical protein n=1 Tax=Streptomyces sp. ME19-01-6 TaxID=3028686 RepID=UPI0029AD377D|nr:hypothetical protein [Streptomyces sp. ME19-01-6]MDX3224164.1 hypothetical protein [Streptomyces sp. ME19-01-6]
MKIGSSSGSRAVTLGTVLLLIALTASCSTGERAADGASAQSANNQVSNAPSRVPETGLAKGLALPLEAYMLDYSDGIQIERGQQRLAVACMARLGFSYAPPQPGLHPPASANDSNMPRRYGITDRQEAQKWGYHVPPRGAQDAPSSTPMSKAEHEALTGSPDAPRPGASPGGGKNGIPKGGCMGEARRKLDADFTNTMADRLNKESFDKTLQDPAVKAVEKRWSACMKDKGYTAGDPYDVTDVNKPAAGPTPSKKEIAVALADIDCKDSTGLVGKMFAVETQIQRGLIEDNQLALNSERKKISAALRASADVT